jgi:hypothetical protein
MPAHRPNSRSCQPSEVRGTRIVMLFLVFLTLFPLGQAQQVKQPSKPAKNTKSQSLESRGKYIVEGVAMGGECHTRATAPGSPSAADGCKAHLCGSCQRNPWQTGRFRPAHCRHAARQRRRTGHPLQHRNLARREASAATQAPISHDPRRRRCSGGLPEITWGGGTVVQIRGQVSVSNNGSVGKSRC